MKKSHWVFFAINSFVLLSLALWNYVSKAGSDATYLWLRWLSEPMAAKPARWGLYIACAGIAAQILERAFSSHAFRKKVVRKVLDEMVKDLLEGDAKEHRLTLFRAAPGWRVWISFLARIGGQEQRWPIVKEYLRVWPFARYLYVYVRPTKARNDRSCAVYRVYRNREGSEGVAGLVWEKDQYILRDLPIIAPGSLKHMKELVEYQPGSAVREYARLTNISRASQLRARERYSRHFYGTLLEGGDASIKWGVLLVDSTKVACPFPEDGPKSKKWEAYKDRFGSYTQVLTHLLT